MTEEEEYQKFVHAVEEGDNRSKTKLAWYLLSGRGGAKIDEDRAVMLLKEQVKDKDSEAMWMLGLCYEYGIGCEQDIPKAETLYKESEESGNVIGELLKNNEERGSGILKVKSL